MPQPKNLLLGALPRDVVDRLGRHTKTVELSHGQVLHRADEEIQHVYFPLTCLISVTLTMADGRTTESAAVGNREMVGLNAVMGVSETTQTEYMTQVPGSAVRLPAEPLLKEFNTNKQMRDVMLQYTQAYIAQISQNVACNRMHNVNQRLARWLLDTCDRVQSKELKLSHVFISHMLGIRRSGVTEAIGSFEEKGLIEAARKSIRMVDSRGLQNLSCECYAVLRKEYKRLLKPL